MTHHKKVDDALFAQILNLSDGGKNMGKPMPFQRDGWYMKDGEKVVQSMLVPDPVTGELQQKGIRRILQESGLFRTEGGHPLLLECGSCKRGGNREASVARNLPCCARAVLSREPYFMEQKEWLAETVEDELGFTILFYPKYHCELNYIELIWGWIKGYHRRSCTYNFADLEAGLPGTMENEIPLLFTIQRYYRFCLGFMSGYRAGLTGVLLDYSARKYKGHRAIPGNIFNLLGDMAVNTNMSKMPVDVVYTLARHKESRSLLVNACHNV
jgi:transposase